MSLKEHEKFWAFIALLIVVLLIGLPSLIWDLDDARVTLADKTISGLMGVLGVAAGLLFRHSKTEENVAETTRVLAQQLPQPPQAVEVVNTAENPAKVEETKPEEPTEDLPEHAR